MDFMANALSHDRRFRTLNILDAGVREALDIIIDTSIPGDHVVRTLDRLVVWRDRPEAIRVDNGPFNRTNRHEVLDAYLFASLDQVHEITRRWIREYNEEGPHDNLGRIPPAVLLWQVESAGNSSFE